MDSISPKYPESVNMSGIIKNQRISDEYKTDKEVRVKEALKKLLKAKNDLYLSDNFNSERKRLDEAKGGCVIFETKDGDFRTVMLLDAFANESNKTVAGKVRTGKDSSILLKSKGLITPEYIETENKIDISKNSELRSAFKKQLEKNPAMFPKLNDSNWEAVSKPSREYNCISNSLRDEKNFHWPIDTDIKSFDDLYSRHGFVPIDKMDYKLQENVEKVVLFALTPKDGDEYYKKRSYLDSKPLVIYDKNVIPTHAIIQEEDGNYSSKNGFNLKIKVKNPEDLSGGSYGNPVRVYARVRKN